MSSDAAVIIECSLYDLREKLKKELDVRFEATFKSMLDEFEILTQQEYRRGFVDGHREAVGTEPSEPEKLKGWMPKRS